MKHVHRSCPFFSYVFEWRFKLRYTERSASLSVLCSINRIYFNDFLLLKASCWEMIRTALCSWQSAVWLFNCIWTIQDQTLKIFQRERNCLVLTVTWKCSTGCVFWIERLSSYELSSVWKVQHFRVTQTGFSWLHPICLCWTSTQIPSLAMWEQDPGRLWEVSVAVQACSQWQMAICSRKKGLHEPDTSRQRKVNFLLVFFVFLLHDSRNGRQGKHCHHDFLLLIHLVLYTSKPNTLISLEEECILTTFFHQDFKKNHSCVL